MELHSVFVTGGNRGIGLEFVRQFARLEKPPAFIFATYRSRDGVQALKDIRDKSEKSRVLLIKMDVTKKNEIESARKIVEDMVGDKGLTLFLNNAAVAANQRFPQLTEENLLYHFKANTFGPMLIIQEFLPLLKKAADFRGQENRMSVNRALVLNIGAAVGSNAHLHELIDVANWMVPSYNISKAALNMLGRIVAANVKDQGILVVTICPGWVKTDMGGEAALLEVEQSISTMLNTLTTLNETHHGQFINATGKFYEF